MQYYSYKAINRVTMKPENGVITADDIETAKMYLKNKQYDIIYINIMSDFLNMRKSIYQFTHRVNKKSVKNFCEQLAFMLDTDISLYDALVFMRDNSDENSLRFMSRPIAEEVRKGSALSDAFANSKFFDDTIIYQLKAAEESGNVPEVLAGIADDLEKSIQFNAKIKGAMLYPSIIFIVFNLVMIILMVYIVPMLTQVILNMGGTLPLITRIIIKLSDMVRKGLPIVITLLAAGIIGYKMVRSKNEQFCIKADRLKLKIPIINKFIMLSSMSVLCKTVAALQKSNIALGKSLYISHKSISNVFLQNAVKNVSRSIDINGLDFGQALINEVIFPNLMIQMIKVGNRTGKVIQILEKLSARYDFDMDIMLKNITKLIEPIMIVVLGIAVGFVVVGIYMAMFSIGKGM